MYTVISYRENRAVYRGGYMEGSTDSKFEMKSFSRRENALSWAISELTENYRDNSSELTPNSSEFYAFAELMVAVDGWFGYDFQGWDVDDELDAEDATAMNEDIRNFLEEARCAALKKVSDAERYKREQARMVREESLATLSAKQEQKDREELARLRAIYGD